MIDNRTDSVDVDVDGVGDDNVVGDGDHVDESLGP